jgi:hypothetical protein
VDDVPGRQVTGAGGLRVAGRAPAQAAALLHDRRAARPVDRPVHPASAEQSAVRGVHDRVDGDPRDVALHELQLHGHDDPR